MSPFNSLRIQDLPSFSNETLIELHTRIASALQKDDCGSGNVSFFGVRDFSDWRQWRNAIESELSDRNVSFDHIDF